VRWGRRRSVSIQGIANTSSNYSERKPARERRFADTRAVFDQVLDPLSHNIQITTPVEIRIVFGISANHDARSKVQLSLPEWSTSFLLPKEKYIY
jgi:hypothetical protein